MSEAIKEQGAKSLRRFKPYPAYKDSGVEWLGEIPAHWEVKALKRIGGLQAGAGFPDDEQGVTTEDIPFFKVGDMGSTGNEREMVEWQHTISKATARRLRAFVFPPGTIVFAKVGAALKLNRRRLLTRPSSMDNNMMGFIPGDCDLTWAMYWLSGLDMGELANPGAVPSVNEGQMRDTPAIVPPEREQRAIAAFLDHETARIDALVAKKERLIELLQEKRAALITRAVTKGLDPNVPMKDSGVEWLGEIPAHWEVWRLKHVSCGLTVGVVVNPSQYVSASGVPFLRGADVSQGRIVLDRVQYMSEDANQFHHKSTLRAGDLISIRVGYPGVTAVVPTELDGSNCASLLITRRSPRVDSQLLCYLMNSAVGKAQFKMLQDGAAQEQINVSDAVDFLVPLPPRDEQASIVQNLSVATAKIDALVAKVRDASDRLKELRTALISAAVTGKIDVREEAAA